MNAIIIAFTLKGQDFEKIRLAIADLRLKLGADNILIHGHMPRIQVIRKGYDTKLCDLLDGAFPVQLIMFNEGTLREEMVKVGKKLEAKVYVLGEVKEGVATEVELYKAAGLTIAYIPL